MDNQAQLYQLLTWFSPGYPIGAYTYSHGLEWAVEEGQITTAESAKEWIADLVTDGDGFADAVFVAESLRAAKRGNVAPVAEFAAQFMISKEFALESHAQGRAFLEISRNAWPTKTLEALGEPAKGPHAFPVVVGCLCAGHGIDERSAVTAYLHGYVSNLISAAVRLVPLGQTDGQKTLAALQPTITATIDRALDCSYDEVTSSSILSDIASMNHETQHTRLFRS